MESNKDEALKCLTIAKKSLELGDYSKALRFTEKSIRLFPTSQGEQLLSIVQKKNAEPRKPTASAPTTTKTSAKRQTTPEPVQERKYTVEQLRAVKTMLAYGKDYYKILSVDKSATDAEIKKAYRKQALQFHPDKNSAPGADEAFKLVAKAFDILSDSNKRVIHDEGGDADGSRGRSSASSYHQQQHAYNRRQGADVSPEDLFNMFFGGGMRNSFGPNMRAQQQQQRYRQQQQQQRFRQQHTRQQHDREEDVFGNLSQMMPIILIAILAIFAILFTFEGEPLYTFRPSPSNTNIRNTRANNVNYYVNPKVFDITVKNNMHKFSRTERQIESDWLGELRTSCHSEQRHRDNLMTQADGVLFGIVGRNEKAYKKAEKMKLKHCDELRRLGPKIRR